MDVEAVRLAVEQACIDFKEPGSQARAESVLLQFRQAPQPLAACRHILEHSASVEARFHAACTLREAVVREWGRMGREEVLATRTYVLHYIMKTAGDAAAAVVRSTLTSALALMLKRGWLEDSDDSRRQFLQEVQGVAQACATASAQRVVLELFLALVQEFAMASASPLGLTCSYHEQCSRDLEDNYLKNFFMHAVMLSCQAAASGAAVSGEDAGVCSAAMGLLAAVLAWDFRKAGQHAHLSAAAAPRRGPSDSSTQQPNPGQSWTDLLLSASTLDWLILLLQRLSAAAAAAGGAAQQRQQLTAPLATQARALLVAFCSLPGDVFPKQETDPQRLALLRSVLRVLTAWIHPAETALALARAADEAQLVDACRCIAALAPTHRIRALVAADVAGPAAPGGGFLLLLQRLTEALVAAGGVGACDDEPWLHECTDMLLEAWSALLQPDSSSLLTASSQLPAEAADMAARVFCCVAQAALRDAAAGAHEDAEDEDEAAAAAMQEDWMVRAAGLARCAPAVSFAWLADQVTGAQRVLYTAATTGADPSEPLEQLCWLLRMSAHCLADSGAGETPLLPTAVEAAVESGGAGAEAVVRLCGALLEVPALVLQEAARPVMSPRLMEVSVWALARWCDTYLFPEEALPVALQRMYGSGEASTSAAGAAPGASLLSMVVQVANTCMVTYPGEALLHAQVVGALLPVLVRRKGVASLLLGLQGWQQLAAAFAGRQPVLMQQLGQKLHRGLAQHLCMAAGGTPDPKAAQEYVGQLMGKTASEVAALAARPDLPSLASRADVLLTACCLLEALRGSSRAVLGHTQPALFSMVASLMGPLLALQRAFAGHASVVALLLKLAAEVVESHVSYLTPSEVDLLLRWVLQLLQQYADHNRSTTTLSTARSLKEERQADQYRDLRALLRLLSHVTQRDIAEQAEGAGGQQQQGAVSTAQAVLLGLDLLLPLMSPELLLFPKLCRSYFNLLAYALENYPEQVCQLQPGRFEALMSSLAFGLVHTDGVVVQSALEGLAGMARHQHSVQQAGGPGFNVHTAPGGKSVLAHFMEMVLRRLLFEDTPLDLVELAGDTLLPLISCDPGAFNALGTALVQTHGQADAATGAKISAALSGLLHNNGVTQELSRANKRLFRQNLCAMVSDVRGLIRMR